MQIGYNLEEDELFGKKVNDQGLHSGPLSKRIAEKNELVQSIDNLEEERVSLEKSENKVLNSYSSI